MSAAKKKPPAPATAMRIDFEPLSELRRWPRNPKKHDHDGIEASMVRFGMVRPLLYDEGTKRLVAGHGGLETLQRRRDAGEPPPARIQLRDDGEWLVPVVRGIRFKNAGEAEAYLLADNRLTEKGGYEEKLLATMLQERIHLGDDALLGTGFSMDEAAQFAKLLDDGKLGRQATGGTEDGFSGERPAEPKTAIGDLYVLGDHRLVCGDSTMMSTFHHVTEGKPVDLVFTDPPYGVSFGADKEAGSTEKGARVKAWGPIVNDDLEPEALQAFLGAVFKSVASVMRAGAAIYVFHADKVMGVRPAFETAFCTSFTLSATLIWVKNAGTMGWQDYRSQHEPILYGWKTGAGRIHVEDRTETTVWEIARDASISYVHPTQKPIELPARAIRNSSNLGDTVLDAFGGSGSTLIACEQMGRKARLVEIDPGYCDVIVARWEKFTGRKATRIPAEGRPS